MLMLAIEIETEIFTELRVFNAECSHLGGVFVDTHAVRYTMNLKKGAIPKNSIEKLCIFADEIGRNIVDIYTKEVSENTNGPKIHTFLSGLNLIKEPIGRKISLGYFESERDSDLFKKLLIKFGYPMEDSNKCK